MLRRYLDVPDCRWHQLLAYFGEASSPRCGRCDVCDALGSEAGDARNRMEPDRADAAQRPGRDDRPAHLAVGQLVVHDTFGEGEVVDVGDDDVTVLFAEAGYRVLDVDLAAAGLLQPRAR
jgi:ATP-dependent DNA helicase RecQ